MSQIHGILLAGGSGTRLWPLTTYVNKHLCPIYDKPLIYYPLTLLILAGCEKISIVINSHDEQTYASMIKYLHRLHVDAQLIIQDRPGSGIPSAILAAQTSQNTQEASRYLVALGDNIIVSTGLIQQLLLAPNAENAVAFSQKVADPRRFGIVVRDADTSLPLDLVEKPTEVISKEALVGFYSFPSDLFALCSDLLPSERGETEITDLLRKYLKSERLAVTELSRGSVWLDAGTTDAISQASTFIQMTQDAHNYPIGSIEEAALTRKLIEKEELIEILKGAGASYYAKLLIDLICD